MTTYFCPIHGPQATKPCPLCGTRLTGNAWVKIRKQVLARYSHRCAAYTSTGSRCLVHAPLEVHHLDADKANNNPLNLVPLCRKHHVHLPQTYAEPELPLLR